MFKLRTRENLVDTSKPKVISLKELAVHFCLAKTPQDLRLTVDLPSAKDTFAKSVSSVIYIGGNNNVLFFFRSLPQKRRNLRFPRIKMLSPHVGHLPRLTLFSSTKSKLILKSRAKKVDQLS